MMECMKELGDKLHSMGLDKGDMLYVGSDVLYLLYEAREKYNVESPEEQDAFHNADDDHGRAYSEEGEHEVHQHIQLVECLSCVFHKMHTF